jgi:hypothetical protein
MQGEYPPLLDLVKVDNILERMYNDGNIVERIYYIVFSSSRPHMFNVGAEIWI